MHKRYIQGGPKKKFINRSREEKCLKNSKILFDGVFFSYIFTSSQEVGAF